MTFPTHILVGLIIGKISGNYGAAITGSLIIDSDHVFSYFRHKLYLKPRKFLKAITDQSDPWGDQRNFLHTLFAWFFISFIFLMVNFKLGLVFSIAYLFHLVLDALDGAVFYPFFPFKNIVLKGPIRYFSKQEIVFSLILLMIFFII